MKHIISKIIYIIFFSCYNFNGDCMSKYKESKEYRKKRVNNSIKMFTKIIKPKKGKNSYDRKKIKKDF